jgi:signal recognition particle receptor subunit beta
MSYVIAANFQDIDNAWFPEDLRIALRIPAHIPIVPCAAWHVQSVTDVLLTLFEMVLEELNPDQTTGAGV